jgi:polysaccharide biosynthesis protein PelG
MAGIGFELRKLLRRDDLLGIVQGYGHSALASTGPWLLTILTLAGMGFLGRTHIQPDDLYEFRLIVIYNFAFSLVMTGPIVMVATRYLADAIYAKKVDEAPSMMLGYMLIVLGIGALTIVPFYVFYAELSRAVALLAIVNFFIISSIWLISAFLSALKNYGDITRSFALGTIGALGSAAVLARFGSTAAMLLGFSLGFALVLFSLIARVFAEYPYPVTNPFRYGKYFRNYWQLALSGLVYNMAIWVDKWIMWFAPQREQFRSGLILYPDYDSALFLAYLTIVPAIAAFVMTIETDFYESYLQFYGSIQNHACFAEISRAQEGIIGSILRGARTLIVVQGSICLATILLSPKLFSLSGIDFGQIGIFRIGVLGAFFHTLLLALTIVLSYFDLRSTALKIQVFFLLSNAFFTYVSMRMGFSYYGFGYFIATLMTFGVAFLAVARSVDRLPYQTFLTGNASIES